MSENEGENERENMNEYENENELTAMTVLKEFHGMGKTFAFSELIQD